MQISKSRIMCLMANKKLTAKALAEKMAMRPQNLSTILNRGYCKPITAARIAEGLGVPVSEIIKGE